MGSRAQANGRAWQCFWPCIPSGPAARLCRLVPGCACSRLLLFALPGLHLTFILPLISFESYLSHQNSKILPKSTDKPQYKDN